MAKFRRKVDISDKEAWLLTVCIRVFKTAVDGYPYVSRSSIDRVLDYLKARFGNAQSS